MSTPTEQEGPTPIAGEPAPREPGKPVPQLPSEQPLEQPIETPSRRSYKLLALLQVLLLLGAVAISSYALYTVATYSEPNDDSPSNNELLIRTEGRDADGMCAEGGSLIMIGSDQNANQFLDGNEITSTTTVCHGERGPSGYSGSGSAGDSSLIETSSIEVGNGTCIAGGIMILAGIDTNTNDELDEGEVQSTNLLCNGPLGPTGSQGGQGMDGAAGIKGGDGAPALVVQNTPLASVCPIGVEIAFGIDDGSGEGTAMDGSLHNDEVRSTLNICSQPLFVGVIDDYTTGTTNGITTGCDQLIWLPKADRLLTSGSDGANGCELWSSDATAEQSTMLLDINPNGDASPGRYAGFSLIEVDGIEHVVFDADDGVNGRMLWATDGTLTGTVKLTSNISTTVGSSITSMAWNDGLVMLNTPNTMLWTNVTTTMDIVDHPSVAQGMSTNDSVMYAQLSAFQSSLLESKDEWLWFSAKSATGIEPYALNIDGRLLAWDLVSGDANPGPSTALQDGRVMVADNGQGRQLIQLNYDGSQAWLTSLMNTNNGLQANRVAEYLGLHTIGDRIIFDALTSGVDASLWAHNLTQGTTTLLSTSILAPGDLTGGTLHNERLWFDCVAPNIAQEICSSDGTVAGTQTETDMRAGAASALVRGFASTGDHLFVVASGQENGIETGSCLWKLSTNVPPELMYDPWAGLNNNSYSATYGSIHATEHHVLFAANDGDTGHEWHAYSHAQLSGTWLIWPS